LPLYPSKSTSVRNGGGRPGLAKRLGRTKKARRKWQNRDFADAIVGAFSAKNKAKRDAGSSPIA
jgi:hypothetical protein